MNQKLHTKAVTCLQLVQSDTQLVSAGLDGQIILWTLTGGIPLSKLRIINTAQMDSSSAPSIVSLAYHPQRNVLISCGGKDERRLTFWDLNQTQPKVIKVIQATYEGELCSMSLRNDNQGLAVADDSGEVKLFNYEDGRLLKLSNNGHAASVTALQVSPDNKLIVSGDATGGLILWDLQ